MLVTCFLYTRPARNTFQCITRQLVGFLIALCWAVSVSSAEHTAKVYRFDIPALPVQQALRQVAQQTGHHLLVSSELIEPLKSQALRGEYTVLSALAVLLKGTGLSGGLTEHGVIVVRTPKAQGTITSGEEMMEIKSKIKSKKKVLASVISFFMGANSAVLYAQEDSSAEVEWLLEEIVVTATRRETSLQETAISISVLDSSAIESKNLVSMSDYLRTTPGVSMIDRGAGRNGVFVRGVTADPQNGGAFVGPTTAIYFNDTPLTQRDLFGTSDIKLIDMARVEILRGPQGTLYGDGSLGGAVRNIPNAPDLTEFGGRVTLGYSNTAESGGNNDKVEGVINVPLIEDKLAVRAVAYRHSNEGYIDNIAGSDPVLQASSVTYGAESLAINKRAGDDTYEGGRISLLWKPHEDFNVSLTHLTQDLEQEGMAEVDLGRGTYEQARYQFGDAFGGGVGGGEGLISDVDITILGMEYDLGWATAYSSSSWTDNEAQRLRTLGAFFSGHPPMPQQDVWNNEVFTQELRLVSSLDGPVQFVTGFYYSDNDGEGTLDVVWGGDPALNDLTPGNPVFADWDYVTSLKQTAFFGELVYQINDEFELTVGTRVFDYEDDLFTVHQPALFDPGGLVSSPEGSDDGSTYKLNLAYTPDEDVLVYATWSEGFRLGRSFNPVPRSICDVDNDGILDGTSISVGITQTGPDTLESFELGGKFSFAGDRVIINAAVYRNNWDDMPFTVVGDCGNSVTANIGEAVTEGLEIESSFYLLPNLKVDLGLALTSAELTSDAPSVGAVDGDRLSGSPEKSFNLGVEYDYDLMGHASYIRADYAWVDEFYNNFKEEGEAAGGYSQVNIKSGVELNQFAVSVFVNNLTNSDDFTWIDSVLPYANRLRPRTIGVDLSYNF